MALLVFWGVFVVQTKTTVSKRNKSLLLVLWVCEINQSLISCFLPNIKDQGKRKRRGKAALLGYMNMNSCLSICCFSLAVYTDANFKVACLQCFWLQIAFGCVFACNLLPSTSTDLTCTDSKTQSSSHISLRFPFTKYGPGICTMVRKLLGIPHHTGYNTGRYPLRCTCTRKIQPIRKREYSCGNDDLAGKKTKPAMGLRLKMECTQSFQLWSVWQANVASVPDSQALTVTFSIPPPRLPFSFGIELYMSVPNRTFALMAACIHAYCFSWDLRSSFPFRKKSLSSFVSQRHNADVDLFLLPCEQNTPTEDKSSRERNMMRWIRTKSCLVTRQALIDSLINSYGWQNHAMCMTRMPATFPANHCSYCVLYKQITGAVNTNWSGAVFDVIHQSLADTLEVDLSIPVMIKRSLTPHWSLSSSKNSLKSSPPGTCKEPSPRQGTRANLAVNVRARKHVHTYIRISTRKENRSLHQHLRKRMQFLRWTSMYWRDMCIQNWA